MVLNLEFETMNSKVILLLLCACLLTSETIRSSSQTGTVPEYASLCPNSVCNSTRSETEDFHSCCQRCSCRPDCYKVASCCPDVHTSESPEFEYPCVDLNKLSNEERGVDYRNDAMMYRLVNSCPDERSSMTYPRCGNASSLQDYVPVSDIYYEKVFRNRHCAACHNISLVVPWYLSVTCGTLALISFETFDERNDYILKHCSFVPVPSEATKTDLSRCYTKQMVESICDMSTHSSYYYYYLQQECHRERPNQNTVYTVYHDYAYWRFSNVYCYLCDKMKHLDSTDTCKGSHVSSDSRERFLRFSAILDFDEPKTETVTEQCPSSDIWDPFDAVCRRLLCSSGTITWKGKCQSMSLYSYGFSLTVLFEVVSPKDRNIVFYPDFLISAVQVIMECLGPDFQCGYCDAHHYKYWNETNTYIRISFFTTKACSQQYLTEKLRDLVLKKNVTVGMNGKDDAVSVILKAVLEVMDGALEDRNVISVDRRANTRICIDTVQLTYLDTLTCPSLKLTKYEFDQLNLNQSSLKKLIDSNTFVNSTNSSVLLCADEYFLMRKSAMVHNGCKQLDITMPTLNILLFYIFSSLNI